MRVLTNAQYDELMRRMHKAEAERDVFQQHATDADGRYGLLIERVLKADQIVPMVDAENPLQPSAPRQVVPAVVQAALEEFTADGDLYVHNQRWAEYALLQGGNPDDVARAIRYGEQYTDSEIDSLPMAVLS